MTAIGLRYIEPAPTTQSNAFLHDAGDAARVLRGGDEHGVGGGEPGPPVVEHGARRGLAVGVERGDLGEPVVVVDDGTDPPRRGGGDLQRGAVRGPALEAAADRQQRGCPEGVSMPSRNSAHDPEQSAVGDDHPASWKRARRSVTVEDADRRPPGRSPRPCRARARCAQP